MYAAVCSRRWRSLESLYCRAKQRWKLRERISEMLSHKLKRNLVNSPNSLPLAKARAPRPLDQRPRMALKLVLLQKGIPHPEKPTKQNAQTPRNLNHSSLDCNHPYPQISYPPSSRNFLIRSRMPHRISILHSYERTCRRSSSESKV